MQDPTIRKDPKRERINSQIAKAQINPLQDRERPWNSPRITKVTCLSRDGLFGKGLFLRGEAAPDRLQLRCQRNHVPPKALLFLVQILQQRIDIPCLARRPLSYRHDKETKISSGPTNKHKLFPLCKSRDGCNASMAEMRCRRFKFFIHKKEKEKKYLQQREENHKMVSQISP